MEEREETRVVRYLKKYRIDDIFFIIKNDNII